MRPVPSRRQVSAAAAASAAVVPVLVAALVAGVGPLPGAQESTTVRAVAANGPLGYVDDAEDRFDALDGAHPVTRVTGPGVTIRPAVDRKGTAGQRAAGHDVSDIALPARVLAAYKGAAASLGRSDPGCRLTWPLLAGIGKVESGHAAGGAVDRTGDTLFPILGPALDGSPGVAAIPDTDDGRWDTDRTWDRAVGPMQFIPSSWVVHGADGNGDGDRDPNNVVDASLASAGYLCTGDRDLTTTKDRRAAVFSYNHSWDYVDLVLAWAEAYAGGTPVLTGTLLAAGEPTGRAGGHDARASVGGAAGDARERVAAPGVASPGPDPAPSQPPSSQPAPAPSTQPSTGPAPTSPTPHPSTAPPSPDPTGTPSPTCPSGDPSPTASSTGGTTTPEPDPSATPTPTPEPTGSGTAEPTPTGSPDPCGRSTPNPSP